MTHQATTAEAFATWAIVELMGHRRVVARVTEQTIAGHGFLRLDEPETATEPARTQLVSPSSVYAIHPCTEDAAMVVADQWRHMPLSHYDLPEQWRKAITAKPEERCVLCDHKTADHGANGCGHRIPGEVLGDERLRCPCRQPYASWADDPWGGKADPGDEGEDYDDEDDEEGER